MILTHKKTFIESDQHSMNITANSKENKIKAPNVKKHSMIFEIDYRKLVEILSYVLRKVYRNYNGNNEDVEINWFLEDKEDYIDYIETKIIEVSRENLDLPNR